MIFFYEESKSKIFFGGEVGAGVSEFFFWGEGVEVGVDGRTDEQAHIYLPFQLLRSWGHNNE